MTNKIFKEFIRNALMNLEEHQESMQRRLLPKTTSGLNPMLEHNNRTTWCRSIDRSLAYTWESFCKIVLYACFQDAHTWRSHVITPEDIKRSVARLFRLNRTLKQPNPPTFDERKYYKYIKWATEQLKHRKGSRRNLTWHRRLTRILEACKNRRRCTNLQIYINVKPVHKIKTPPLSQVFNLLNVS